MMRKIFLIAASVLFLGGLPFNHALAQPLDFGDAPEGAPAYLTPAPGVPGLFPTCINVGPATWIQHNNFFSPNRAWFGPTCDPEVEGNGGICPSFTPYDNDECFADGDAGLLIPPAYTIVLPLNVVPCPNAIPGSLGQTCQMASWGPNVDILVTNVMPGGTMGFVNVLMDWDQSGVWGGSSTCPQGGAPEHVLINFLVPNGFSGPLSVLGPPPFRIGPKSGYVWTRFTITEVPVALPWNGAPPLPSPVLFEDGESEDYLLRVDPEQQPTFLPEPTECQVVETECPREETHCPVENTICPIITTQCPAQPAPTICPEVATQCPVVDTECPTLETKCPLVPTHCPVEQTLCPKDPPICPPEEFTIWPAIPTQCPVVFTACPAGPTFCPAPPTACPMQPTWCPPVETQCPIEPAFTVCPLNPTQCPVEPTKCPPQYTNCPEIPTVCPVGAITTCPEVPTQCPVVPTVCQTPAPTVCPVDPTYCPLVDSDGDGVVDCNDNCPKDFNPGQEDTYPPGGNSCGDACECEGNFDDNFTVDGLDAAAFKADYGRSSINRPCTNANPCNGDFSCNGNVDGLDAALFKSDFGRSGIKNPCPICPTDPWCVYP